MKPILNDSKCEYRYFRSNRHLIYRIREEDSKPCDLQEERDPNYGGTTHSREDCNNCTMDHRRYRAEYRYSLGWWPASATCFSKSYGSALNEEISEGVAII